MCEYLKEVVEMNRLEDDKETENDRKMGQFNEKKLKSILDKRFGVLTKKTERFSIIDFENDKYLVELKSRKISSSHYPTTIIGYNKIEEFLRSGKKCYAVFHFTDNKTLYYKITNKKIKGLEIGYVYDKKHLFIPIKLLKTFPP